MKEGLNIKLAEQVLEYWFLTEFLAQDKYPEFKNQDVVSELKDKQNNKKRNYYFLEDKLCLKRDSCINVYEAISNEASDCGMECWSDATIYIGKVKRSDCIESIAKIINYTNDSPEKDDTKIALISLQVSPEGKYKEHSLSISPIVWVLSMIKKNSRDISGAISIDVYKEIVESIEKQFFLNDDDKDKVVSLEKLEQLLLKVYSDYLKDNINNYEDNCNQNIYEVFFTLYLTQKHKDNSDEIMYLGLGNSFYSKDIEMVLEKLKNKSLFDSNKNMVKSLIEYICESQQKKYKNQNKIDLVKPENETVFAEQVNDIFDIRNAPLGKWPSKFSPAFMQQAAINLQVGKNKTIDGNIFSVNGPPGTGKTTLLKEIVVNNIVERTILLAEYDEPWKAFQGHNFKKGDKVEKAYNDYIKKWYSLKNDNINDYSILVTSSNNTAVENISKELPKSSSIFEDLKIDKNDSDEYKEVLEDLKELFDVESSGINEIYIEKNVETSYKDIYFSQYAQKLINKKDKEDIQGKEDTNDNQDKKDEPAWGLIAAALGKKSNIKTFYDEVVAKLVFNGGYSNNKNLIKKRIERYSASRKRFKDQLSKVENMKNELSELCDISKSIYNSKAELNLISIENNKKIWEINNHIDIISENLRVISVELNDAELLYKEKETNCKDLDTAIKKETADYNKIKSILGEYQREEFKTRSSVGFFTKIFNKKKYISAMNVADNIAVKAGECKREMQVVFDNRVIIKKQLEQARIEFAECEENIAQIHKVRSLQESNKKKLDNARMKLQKEIETYITKYNELKEIFERKYNEIKLKGDMYEPKIIDDKLLEDLVTDDIDKSTQAQISNVWTSKIYDYERIKLFNYAMRFNKEFVLSSKGCRDNLKTLAMYWGLLKDKGERIIFDKEDIEEFLPSVMQTLFLIVPVISSTFASVGSMFRDVKKGGIIGTLIVDEAGQAPPQYAIGALYRSRKAMTVGDPKQVEPVVTDDLDMLKRIISTEEIKSYSTDKTISVQGFADAINPVGTYLENPGEDEDIWVGCPLIVHRRCISPMYDISNAISYNGIMKQQTKSPKEDDEKKLIYDSSMWIEIKGKEKGDKNHYVKEQGELVCKMLETAFHNDKNPSVYIISPFTTVVNGVKSDIKKHFKNRIEFKSSLEEWIKNNVGTVHTFQGKEANEVIFILGCDKTSSGAIGWVNTNIVNVAATRAKYRLYIIGDSEAWQSSSCVSEAKIIIDNINEDS